MTRRIGALLQEGRSQKEICGMLGISSSCVNANSPYERGIQIEPSQTVFQSTHPVRGATRRSPHWRIRSRFQSTHPSRDATLLEKGLEHGPAISIHAPRGGVRPAAALGPCWFDGISIHAPRGGVRLGTSLYLCRERKFQSTHPVRGATKAMSVFEWTMPISIHAPREGCDFTYPRELLSRSDFNPRTP